jgi:hypothetical protein
MPQIYLTSHWQTGNSVLQLAMVAILMHTYGYELASKVDDETVIIKGTFNVLTETMGIYILQTIMTDNPPFKDFFTKDIIIEGYFQNSEPLVKFRETILDFFTQRECLHFPITNSGASIKDLMNTNSPVELLPTDVVVHIRLGDYRKANWIIDPAPQLAILREIRRTEPATRIILVCAPPKTGAERNYLGLFEEFHPLIQSGTEVEDFAALRSANRILVSNSTFSWAAAWLGSATQRWIPEPAINELGAISDTDNIYKAAHGYPLETLDIPSELLPVTGEFLQELCDYTVMDAKKEGEFGMWIHARKLFIESEWPGLKAKSLFIYPEERLLETVVARGPWPELRLVVVHNGDNQVNYSVLIPFLEANPKLYAWIQNNTVSHPRIRSLPIAEQNRMWRGGRLDWEPTIKICRAAERDSQLVFPWCSATNPIRAEWLQETKGLRGVSRHLEILPKLSREDYTEALISAKAIICPPGNGLDTHRHWETLYRGAWAVVHDNSHSRCLLAEYPSLPLLPISGPADLPGLQIPEAPSPFHPMLLRRFWKTLFASYVGL